MFKKITNINSLNEISDNDLKDNLLLINIDRGCLIPEFLIAEAYNNNPFLRNKIIKNTNKSKFNYTKNLIPTRYNLNNFIKNSMDKIIDIIYVTNNINYNEEEIKKNLAECNLPNKKIINVQKNINDFKDHKIIYIDSQIDNLDQFNNIKKLKVFKLNVFN